MMVLLESNVLDISFKCPDFSLTSVDDKRYSLKDFNDKKALLVAFICNHCPYVKAIEDRLIKLNEEFNKKNFAMVAICSNDPVAYPADSKEELYKSFRNKNYGFPYLVDEDQNIAKAFGAVCTPDLFLFDGDRKLYYHGRLDDNWKDEKNVTEHSLKNAINDLLSNKPSPKDQKPSMGCSIKWKD